MDNATHSLFALTLARTPLGRAGRGSAAALLLASNAPDIDFVTGVGGVDNYLTWHRGPTHGALGVVGLALVVAAIISLALRVMRRFRAAQDSSPALPERSPDATFRALVPVAMVGVLCHILMDLPTSYGTRLLSPFDWHWFAIDWMPIIDIYLLAALAAGLLFGAGSAVARRRNVVIVFALMTLDYGVRGVAHHAALANAPRLFGPLLPQPCDAGTPAAWSLIDYWPRPVVMKPGDPGKRCLVQLAAIPTFLSPFQWRVIAHLSNAYEIHDINLMDRRFWRAPDGPEVLWRTTLRVPNVWTPPVWSAASTSLARTFLGFSRLPAVRTFGEPSGVITVRWGDVRFSGARMALATPQNDPFTVIVRVAPDGSVVEEHLGP
jgi:membrane-bound metal-dependent hydrolase YbcI (DUF457 family)